MNEYELFRLIRAHLLSGFADNSLSGVRVVRSYQQIKATAPNGPAIIMHAIGSQRVGWQGRDFRIEGADDNKVATRTDTQNHIKTFQFNALVPLPAPGEEADDTLTAGDLLDMAAMLLQNGEMLALCKANGLGIERITAITPNYVQDENDNWEYEPSFDLSVAVKKVLSHSVGVVTSTDVKIYPV